MAEDLAQETFTRVLRSVQADGARQRDPIWPLLRTRLVRLAADRRRAATREIGRLLLVATRDRPAFEEGDGSIVQGIPRHIGQLLCEGLRAVVLSKELIVFLTTPGSALLATKP